MTQPLSWLDREFDFGLPASKYPSLVERLRGTPARLEELVGGLSRSVLIHRDGDKWSIQENVGHLLDLEPLWLGRLHDYLAGRDTLRPADMDNRKTHEANHNDASLADLLASFRLARGALVKRLDVLDEDFIQRSALHPRLEQETRLVDLVYFIAEHDDHHLARIRQLARLFGRKPPRRSTRDRAQDRTHPEG